jgi:hypothetical protein
MNHKLSALTLATLLACGTAHAQSNKEMAAQIKQLQEQLQLLRAELDGIKKQQAEITDGSKAVEVTTSKSAEVITRQSGSEAAASVKTETSYAAAQESPISFFGYGEMNFTRPKNDPASSVATARRGVFGWGYRFNERTRFVGELEIENAVVSQSDAGEVALEQFYIEHDINEKVSTKLGLFLMPFGYMNESHEPTRYYGVQRNFVETAIIPSTWREMGVGFKGTTDEGWRWDAGAVTSFDLSKWPTDNGNPDTLESPLGAIHQEGQNAKAASGAYYGAVNYNAIPGVNLGGAIFHGGIGQRQATASVNASVTLSELHARWQSGAWDVQTVAALGQFHDVAAINAGATASNPLPDQFRGWYAQAAYRLWRQGDYSLTPFTRYERFNTALGFSGVPQGAVIDNAQPDVRVWTVGANFYLHPQVVLKADFQKFLNDSSKDRYNLGVGFHY